MARVIKEQAFTARRNEILDVAQKLVYTLGFDQMTIQNLLDELQISKGAFYHYFDSKADVLGALIERMVTVDVEPLLKAIVDDPNLTALEKLHGYFATSARWKSERKEMIISMMRIWYSDENVVFRQKFFSFSLERIIPMLGDIIRQGIGEGVFDTPFPDHVGRVIIYIFQGLTDTLADLLLNAEGHSWHDPLMTEAITDYIMALTDTMERILGAPKGSIHIIDPEALRIWFVSPSLDAVLVNDGKEHGA